MKEAEHAPDLPAWRWLHDVITALGVEGMSSEESDIEDSIHTVYRTKWMEWRRDLSAALRIVDEERYKDKLIYHSRGSKPAHRQRLNRFSPLSTHPAVPNLAQAFYDDEWWASLDEEAQLEIDPSGEDFQWVDIVAA